MRLSWVGHRIWSDSTLVDCARCTVKGCVWAQGPSRTPNYWCGCRTARTPGTPTPHCPPLVCAHKKQSSSSAAPLAAFSSPSLSPFISTQDICPYCITCICHVWVWEAFGARDSAKKPTAWRGPIINSHLVLELDFEPVNFGSRRRVQVRPRNLRYRR
jgi:hypothetical protein